MYENSKNTDTHLSASCRELTGINETQTITTQDAKLCVHGIVIANNL